MSSIKPLIALGFIASLFTTAPAVAQFELGALPQNPPPVSLQFLGYTHAEVASILPGSGLRFATEAEMWGLVEWFGYDDNVSASLNYAAVDGFFGEFTPQHFGQASTAEGYAGYNIGAMGWIEEGRFNVMATWTHWDESYSEGYVWMWGLDEGAPGAMMADARIGHFVVPMDYSIAQPIPEPALSVLVIVLFAAGFVLQRRRGKRPADQ
jgi:hypothetical protein